MKRPTQLPGHRPHLKKVNIRNVRQPDKTGESGEGNSSRQELEKEKSK